MKKRIGIIANTSWNILNFRMGLITALKNAGYEVCIIAPLDEHTNDIRALGHDVTIVNALSRKGTNPLKDLQLINELKTIYKQLRLDVVLQYTIKPNIYGSLAGYLANVTTISTVTGLGYVFLNNGMSSSIAKRLYQFAFKFSNKIFFQNEDDRNLFLQESLVDKHKSDVIPGSGIDIEFYQPSYCEISGYRPAGNGQFTFLMIARLLKDKGVYEYIEAARNVKKRYPNTTFLLLGDQDSGNPTAVSVDDIAKWKEEDVVQMLGFDKDTRKFICQSDAVVLPSYREGIPRVILESFAMGKPCITTDAPGCKHTVDHEVNGFIVKVADAVDLEKNILRFIESSPEIRQKMGENARHKAVTQFSTEIVVNKYIRLLQNL